MTLKKLNLVETNRRNSYLINATGPLAGARLLLAGDAEGLTARDAQTRLAHLSSTTGLTPDVLEDAVCNWQKSPARYVRFSG